MEECKLTLIFKRQAKLMIKYHKIEKRSGLMQTDKVPVDIDSREGQARLKDFAWRITEELVEARCATSVEDHQKEVVDALHFTVELLILAGINPTFIKHHLKHMGDNYSLVEGSLMNRLTATGVSYFVNNSFLIVITNLGLAMNCLKNRPWKTRTTLTDSQELMDNLVRTLSGVLIILKLSGMDEDQIYQAYLDKNQINQDRQAEGY